MDTGTSMARASEREVLLAASGIEVEFSGLVALHDVGVTVGRGEILGIIGPNGAGKTTLLNVLSGFQRPLRGTVQLEGQAITAWTPQRRATAGLARTFQAVRIFPDLTVRENLEVGAVGAGLARRRVREQVAAAAERLQIGDVLDHLAGGLPFGTERRVGIARALAGQPKLLLLDEPAAGLNETESDELLEILTGLRDELDCTLVVIEHDMRLIMRLCDRIQVIDHGQELAVGTPSEIRADPKVIEAYLGAPTHA